MDIHIQSDNQQKSEAQAQDRGLKSLARALDNLMADETGFLYLSLPARTVAEIQKSFTIDAAGGTASGTTDDAGNQPI